MGGISASQSSHHPSQFTETQLRTTCAGTRLHGSHSQQSRTHHLTWLLGDTRTTTRALESATCADTSSGMGYGFSVDGSLPLSVVWMMLRRLSFTTK